MIAWIISNLGTILITLFLMMVVSGIVMILINDKKRGRSTCGGNCAHCKMCTACRHDKKHVRKAN